MKKITTLSELANECGCSTATVSYVLNGRDDQRISEDTKQKILQMANLYQYRINPYAKALAKGEIHNIMFFYEPSDFSLEKSDTLNFINELSSFLMEHKFNVVITPSSEVQKFSLVDAVITYNISKEKFLALANKNFVPVIAVDTIIADPLFYEISNSFNNIVQNDNTIYLSTSYKDEEINNYLLTNSNIKFVNSFQELHAMTNYLKDKNLISFSKEIYNYLTSLNIKCDYYNLNPITKFECIMHAINDSIAKTENENHKFKI